MKNKKLAHASYLEWHTSLFEACAIAFGLGVLFTKYLIILAAFLILMVIGFHSWGMYRIHNPSF